VVSEDASQDNVGAVWSLRGYLERLAADGRDVARLRAGLKELVRGFVRMVAADGLFARQARCAPRRRASRRWNVRLDQRPLLVASQG
jgi:hypothetical protein